MGTFPHRIEVFGENRHPAVFAQNGGSLLIGHGVHVGGHDGSTIPLKLRILKVISGLDVNLAS